MEKLPGFFADRPADFHDEPSTGPKHGAGLGDETFNRFEACRAGENGSARLKFSDFELNLILFRFSYIRRIGDHEVDAPSIETGKQVSVMELDAFLQLMTRGVGAGDFKRRGRN